MPAEFYFSLAEKLFLNPFPHPLPVVDIFIIRYAAPSVFFWREI